MAGPHGAGKTTLIETSLQTKAFLILVARGRRDNRLRRGRGTSRRGNDEHWAIRPGYDGIEHAGVVVVDVRRDDDLGGAARVLDDLGRLRRDRALFDDVLGWRSSRVTAVMANLSNPNDCGTRQVLARLRRTVRAAADLDSARDIG